MEQKHDSKFGTGFVLGIIIGGGLVFLLGTKKGRKILKSLSESGADVFQNLSDVEKLAEMEGDIEEEFVSEATESIPRVSEKNGKARKLFRGIKKK